MSARENLKRMVELVDSVEKLTDRELLYMRTVLHEILLERKIFPNRVSLAKHINATNAEAVKDTKQKRPTSKRKKQVAYHLGRHYRHGRWCVNEKGTQYFVPGHWAGVGMKSANTAVAKNGPLQKAFFKYLQAKKLSVKTFMEKHLPNSKISYSKFYFGITGRDKLPEGIKAAVTKVIRK